MSKLFPNHVIDIYKPTIFSIKYKKEIANTPDKDGYYQTTIYDCYGNKYQARHQVILAEGLQLPKHLWPTEENGRRYIVDHIIPVKNGGTDTFKNLHLIPKPDNNRNEYSRKNYSEAFKNPSEETRKRKSEAQKGKLLSEEQKNKISQSLKGIEHIYQMKKIVQLTLDGKFVKEWPSMKLTEKYGFRQGNISKCCNNKAKTAGGFEWMYKEDYDKLKKG